MLRLRDDVEVLLEDGLLLPALEDPLYPGMLPVGVKLLTGYHNLAGLHCEESAVATETHLKIL